MTQQHDKEKWKKVVFGFEYTNPFELHVSNHGRLRTTSLRGEGNIIKGSHTEGYNIVRVKLFKEREPKAEAKLKSLTKQVNKLTLHLQELEQQKTGKKVLKEAQDVLAQAVQKLADARKEDLRSRTVNYHALTHRLVAEYFLPKPKAKHEVVSHIDYNKVNNHASNLKWMTREEATQHQQNSPSVVAEKERRKNTPLAIPRHSKLTAQKVAQLKKLLNDGVEVKKLVKQFKITDTQILRIKRGINWARIPAAE
jgi:hypothetical protein